MKRSKEIGAMIVVLTIGIYAFAFTFMSMFLMLLGGTVTWGFAGFVFLNCLCVSTLFVCYNEMVRIYKEWRYGKQ